MEVGIDEAREERIARNQTLFRDINDRIEQLLGGAAIESAVRHEFLCECAEETCVEQISINLEDYRRVRADPVMFVVAPGESHVYPEAETVVDRQEGFWVVEKLNAAARVARSEARSA